MARFRRKDLKRPDVFVTSSQRAVAWAMTHQRSLLIAAGALGAVLLAIAALTASTAARLRQANQELAGALVAFRAQDFPEAATELRSVADSWSSTTIGQVARLYAADAQLEAGNPDLAAADLELVLQDALPADYLKQQAALNLGFALETKNDLGAAADRYAEAAALAGPYRSIALFREARLREQLGDTKRAEEAYETFVQDFPNAPEVPLAEARLKGL